MELRDVTGALAGFHRAHGGRTELRIGPNCLAYFDVSLRSVAKLRAYFRTLHSLGMRQAALHSGKFRLESIAPLTLIDVADALTAPTCV